MTKSVRLLLMGAALTGFVAGQNAFAQDTDKKDDTKKTDDAASGKKATKSKKDKHACKGRTPAKAKAAADQPKARMIAKVKANAGQTVSPCQKRATANSFRSSQLKRTGGTPLVLYFRILVVPALFISFMPANRFNGYKDFGVGIGLRIPHYNHIFEKKPVVDWFEIISENYMVEGGRQLQVLDQILERYRVVQHGVSMYFGSAEPLNREHLRRLKKLVRRTNTPWLTDHLCWGSVDGRYSHDLLPMPYTFEAAKRTAQKVREARDFLEVPIAVENVSSYAEYHVSEMTEWEFLNEVVEQADCGILLDVNNIYVSSRNHSFDPFEYLRSIPAERVAQIHIAGHSNYEKYILDTHDHPVLDPVWQLYAKAIEMAGPTATLLEWDDHIPSFDEVHKEALKAKQYVPASAAVAS